MSQNNQQEVSSLKADLSSQIAQAKSLRDAGENAAAEVELRR